LGSVQTFSAGGGISAGGFSTGRIFRGEEVYGDELSRVNLTLKGFARIHRRNYFYLSYFFFAGSILHVRC